MIEGDLLPGRRLMTRGTILAQRAAMRVIRLMAGKTIHWRAFKYAIDMATLASDCGVTACQLEHGAVMIKMDSLPIIGNVTRGAILTQSAAMRVIVHMAGGTILGSCIKVGRTMCTGMAVLTGNIRVFAG